MKKLVLATLALLLALPASAATLFCPGTPQGTDREFGVEVTLGNGSVSCYDFGNGNIPGDNSDFAGWTFIEKDGINNTTGALDLTGISATSGTFGIDLSNWFLFGELLLAFKGGQGQLDPDWAAFRVSPLVLAGNWSVTGQQSLSHANLYGRAGSTPYCTTPDCGPREVVPEPAPLAMLSLALFAIGFGARRFGGAGS